MFTALGLLLKVFIAFVPNVATASLPAARSRHPVPAHTQYWPCNLLSPVVLTKLPASAALTLVTASAVLTVVAAFAALALPTALATQTLLFAHAVTCLCRLYLQCRHWCYYQCWLRPLAYNGALVSLYLQMPPQVLSLLPLITVLRLVPPPVLTLVPSPTMLTLLPPPVLTLLLPYNTGTMIKAVRDAVSDRGSE